MAVSGRYSANARRVASRRTWLMPGSKPANSSVLLMRSRPPIGVTATLYRFILKRVDDPAMAEDIVQDVLIKVYERLGNAKKIISQ